MNMVDKKRKKIIEEYWLKQLAGAWPLLELPEFALKPGYVSSGTTKWENLHIEFPDKIYRDLEKMSRGTDLAFFILFFSMLNVMVYRYTNTDDLVIGSLVPREHDNLDPEPLLFRNRLSGDLTLKNAITQVKSTVLESFNYCGEEYSFDDIMGQVQEHHGKEIVPLFQMAFIDDRLQGTSRKLDQFNIVFCLFRTDQYMRLTAFFKPPVVSADTLQGFCNSLIYFLEGLPGVLDMELWQIDILPQPEKQRLLDTFNQTGWDYPQYLFFPGLVEKHTQEFPDAVALVESLSNRHLTYGELVKNIGGTRDVLRNRGITAGHIVAIMANRALETIIGIFSILTAGAAYLPIEPDYPGERIDYILEDSGAIMGIYANREISNLLNQPDKRLPWLDIPEMVDKNSPAIVKQNLEVSIPQDSAAYVIYTSGSTGKPKGVLVNRGSVLNIIHCLHHYYPCGRGDFYLLKTPFVFDVSVSELFGWLMGGGELLLLEDEAHKDPQRIIDAVENGSVTHINFVPSMFSIWLDQLNRENIHRVASLKYIFVAGEALLPHLVEAFRKLEMGGTRLENLYGPTEGTVYASGFSLSHWHGGPVPIGKPLHNVRLYILNYTGKLQPVGVPGELHIGGLGVAQGYLNRPELTAERFVFFDTRDVGLPGRRVKEEILYKTGDLVRWLPDGNIEYFGRMDFQVKIRGFRIELGEIENQLLTHPGVNHSVVVVKEDKNGERFLCAYVVMTDPGMTVENAGLNEWLARTMPEYMIPAFFVSLPVIPLTASGKIDRKALPDPKTIMKGVEYVPPRTGIEKSMVAIWAEVLGLEEKTLGIDDHFFRLGGHSLKGMVMINRVHKTCQVLLTLLDLFRFPTIRELAAYIQLFARNTFHSLEQAEEKEYYPLTSSQKRLFILDQLEEKNTSYNMPMGFEFKQIPQPGKLEQVFKQLLQRHESFRTSFFMLDNYPVQKILPGVPFSLQIMGPYSLPFQRIEGDILDRFIQPFKLDEPPLVRAALVETVHAWVLLVDMHHIISDGVSIQLFVNELCTLYQDGEVSPLSFSYRDFALWQNGKCTGEDMKQQENFWLNEFSGEMPILSLPTDFNRPPVQGFEGGAVYFNLGSQHTQALNKLSAESGITMFMLVTAIFTVLLRKLSGQEEVVIGIPFSGRRHADLENIVGMFVNTLAIRTQPHGNKFFLNYLQEVKEKTLKIFENQDYPFEELVERVVLHRDPSRNPLFDVMVVVEEWEREETEKSKKDDLLEPIEIFSVHRNTKFDLTLGCKVLPSDLQFSIEYATGLFTRETVERFAGYLKVIFASILAMPNQQLLEIEVLAAEEKKELFNMFCGSSWGYARDLTLRGIVANRAECFGDQAAIVADDKVTTFKELSEMSGKLACYLNLLGCRPGELVGLLVERSLEMMVGILGILFAGCGYVPLNAKAPGDRNRFMLRDCQVKVVLTVSSLAHLDWVHEGKEFQWFMIDDYQLYAHFSPVWPGIEIKPGHVAYVIFTSGSTGNPKGVPITHQNLSPLLSWGLSQLGLGKGERVVQNLSYYFDWSVWEIFISLGSGASLYMVPEEIRLDPVAYIDYLYYHHITVLHITPTQFQYLAGPGRRMDTLKYLFIGAEKLSIDLVKRSFSLIEPGCRVFNMYGPTEATIISAVMEIPRFFFEGGRQQLLTSIPIGGPVGNTDLLVLDHDFTLCPFNVTGELFIGGDGVAQGYLNQPGLTMEKFIAVMPTPLVDFKKEKWARFYRTGDLVRWYPQGQIEFMGRLDHQVKIRGHRIELGEIEHRLSGHEGIKEVLVIDGENLQGEKYLCAYFVPVKPKKISLDTDLRKYLGLTLPDYMVPAFFIMMDEFPLTANGKVDRSALPEPEMERVFAIAPAKTKVERKLVKIWSEILEMEPGKIGRDSHFFHIGGHSLNGVILTTRIHKELNVQITLADLFKHATIRDLACLINVSSVSLYESVQPIEKREYYPLSSAQKRMYILQQMEPASTAYNIPDYFEFEFELDIAALRKIFFALIERHESLRTSFFIMDKEPVQRIHEEFAWELEEYVLGAGQAGFQDIWNRFVRPFDLSRAPLIRVGVVSMSQRCVLLVDMHHAISDGVSLEIIRKEFVLLCTSKEVPQLRVCYRDFACWTHSQEFMEMILHQETYWNSEFSDIPVMELPLDFPRPPVPSFEGHMIHFQLDKEETDIIKIIGRNGDYTLFMVLLAIFSVFLAKLSGQEDIIVGIPVAGRRHDDLQDIVGMFVNTLAFRIRPQIEKTFDNFLADVKEKALANFKNQDYPFEKLVESVVINRDTSHHPLFDVMLVFQNLERGKQVDTGIQRTLQGWVEPVSKFDMTLVSQELGDTLSFQWEYSTRLFKESTIQRWLGYFRQLVRNLGKGNDLEIGRLEMIPPDERQLLLMEFNAPAYSFSLGKTVYELFNDQVAISRDKIALVSPVPDDFLIFTLTYRELDVKANVLANHLRDKGVGPDFIVGLRIDRSVEMIIGCLAILKAGGAYLPISLEYPPARVDYMLTDSGVSILLTVSRVESPGYLLSRVEVIDLDDKHILSGGDRVKNELSLLPVNQPGDLAYVIYTSGTTGKPKGVGIEHRGLINLSLFWKDPQGFGVTAQDRVLQFANFSFDASVSEVFMALFHGAALCLISEEIIGNYHRFEDYLQTLQVTLITLPPPYLAQLEPSRMTSLKRLVTAGSETNPVLVNRWKDRVLYINAYGPTETTICATCFQVPAKGLTISFVPIGRPIFNTPVYIFSKVLLLQPIKVAGQLGIGGIGVARGYLNRPELTVEKFVSVFAAWGTALNKENKSLDQTFTQSLFYLTGDMARWHEDGNIEFLGRNDFQVKIRGFRIEPGEIENVLLQRPGVKEAIVLVRDMAGGEKYICAYVVGDSQLDESRLRIDLSDVLPGYMMPSYFIVLSQFPLTVNGKIDRGALPGPESNELPVEILPSDKLERGLVETWARVLDTDPARIGIHTNFFRLGGHSLKGIALITEIHKLFDVKITLAELFKNPTVYQLVQLVKSSLKNHYYSIEPCEEREFYPLSFSQKQMYILYQMDKKSTAYNIPNYFEIGSELDIERLEKTFYQLIGRHGSLRTSFLVVNREPVQRVFTEVDFHIEDFRDAGFVEPGEILMNFVRPFDLSVAPLLRVGVLGLVNKQYLLMTDMHHAIADGASHEILVNDFIALSRGDKLGELRLQYKDFAVWQNTESEYGHIKEQEEYWLSQLRGNIPTLELPLDFSRPSVQSFEGDSLLFTLNEAWVKRLIDIKEQEECTMFIVMLAIFNIFLGIVGNSDDIIVGTPVAGRRHADLQDIIGMFVNTLVLRNRIEPGKTFIQFLREVKERTLDDFDHEDYPFEELVNRVLKKRDTSRNPLFDVFFTFSTDFEDNEPAGEEGNESPGKIEGTIQKQFSQAKFDLGFGGGGSGSWIFLGFSYSRLLFKKETIEGFIRYIKEIIESVAENPGVLIGEIRISSGLGIASTGIFAEEENDFIF